MTVTSDRQTIEKDPVGAGNPAVPSPWPGFLASYFGWVFDYFEVTFLTLVLVPISRDLGFGAREISIVVAVQLLAFGAGGLLFGRISDTFGRKTALQWSIVLFAAATLARAFTPNLTYLIIFSIVAGIGLGGEYGSGQSLVSETVKNINRGRWSSFLYSGIFVGIMLGSLYGTFVVPAIGWRWSFAIAALPVFALLIARRWISESQVWKRARDSEGVAPARAVLTRRFLTTLLLCVVTASMQLLSYYGITAMMPSYLVLTAGFTLTSAGWWLFFTGVAGICGASAAAAVIDKIGRRLTLSIAAIIGAAGGVAAVLVWQYLDHNVKLVMVAFFFLYAAFGATASVFGSLFSEVFATRVRGTGVSAALQLARSVSAAGPLIGGALYPITGYLPIILGGMGLLVLLSAIAWAFPERTAARIDVQIDTGAGIETRTDAVLREGETT